jgi:two-component system phosphate regulon sensor histidine kinase PhoR
MQAKGIKWLPVLMAVTIAGIAAFQLYWLHKTYEREQRILERSSNMTFRETVHRLQAAKLKLSGLSFDSLQPVMLKPGMDGYDVLRPAGRKDQKGGELQPVRVEMGRDDKMASLVNVLSEKVKDTATDRTIAFSEKALPNLGHSHKMRRARRARLMQFLYEVDSLQDTLKLAEIHAAYERRMEQQNLDVPFAISRLEDSREHDPEYNEVTLGFAHPVTYRLALGNTAPYLLKRIIAPILLSIVIVGLTTLSFLLLYRNLLRQRRLADIKNEFISNITHELKTPIATVSVAIEALRSFNANMDVERSKEYLDISANELQRLSLLVDKVLKLSMFENREIELKYEPLDLKELIAEVTASMRLQSEKHRAAVQVASQGDTTLQGDRLHLVSVIFNLLDNALKYSRGNPKIAMKLVGNERNITLSITDNGIGIPTEYRDKVFDKFFRVPTGNLHNTKGYGLGLSYVAHVVKKHRGTINVEAAAGGGTCFSITLPKQAA